MKRILSIVFALALAGFLSGCDRNDPNRPAGSGASSGSTSGSTGSTSDPKKSSTPSPAKPSGSGGSSGSPSGTTK